VEETDGAYKATMTAHQDIKTVEGPAHWHRTRRNLLAVGAVMAGSLLSGCRHDRQNDHNRTSDPNCFLRGTRILCADGEKRIEELQTGDHVQCIGGKIQTIRWIARRRLPSNGVADQTEPSRIVLCIPQGSLSPDVPHADLMVSAGHRILLDNVLVAASDLPFARSMFGDEADQILYHILLDQHNIIFAEGAPCETLLPNKSTLSAFDNAKELEELCRSGQEFSAVPFAPALIDTGNCEKVLSYLRNAMSPWIDNRTSLDKLRDRLLPQS
jgi:hypothetical protein